jgi:zinc transport system substrate-binding protein
VILKPIRHLFLCILAAGALAGADARAEAPRVAVSIIPLHSLVAGVMAGAGEPYLLMRGSASPHGYALRPSDAMAISEARLLVFVGPSFETFMRRPVAQRGSGSRVLSLLGRPEIRRLPVREGGMWPRHAGNGEDHDHDADEGSLDGHLWLDPRNGAAIVRAVAAELIRLDPGNSDLYRTNRTGMVARLGALEAEIRAVVAPVKDVPYLVFHDAYQYFEARFGTASIGSVAVSPERPPGARRVYELRRKIAAQGVTCVFIEPQFPPDLAAMLIENTPARIGTLDPLGATIEPGPEAYFTLLRNLAAGLRECLGA